MSRSTAAFLQFPPAGLAAPRRPPRSASGAGYSCAAGGWRNRCSTPATATCLISVAPTRSGKGRGVLVPNLLLTNASVVVFDPKGDLYRMTARRRRGDGPAASSASTPAASSGPRPTPSTRWTSSNLDNADLETDAQSLAEWLAQGNRGTKEPFWDLAGSALHSALIAHVASSLPEPQRNLESVRKLLMGGDVTYDLAVLLDTQGKSMNRMAHDEIASFLSTADVTRSGILATALAYIKPFLSPRMAATLSNSTFDLKDLIRGEPLSIYLVLPPDKLRSHKALLKMWVGTLLKAITSRTVIPTPPHPRPARRVRPASRDFPTSETLITLCAGFGVQCWTFWQDMAQLKTCYPTSWETILNNCAVVQTFGIHNRRMATQWGDYLEHGPDTLANLPPEREVVHVHGQGEFCCRRPDYLSDPLFAGLFDDNPFAAGVRRPARGGEPLNRTGRGENRGGSSGGQDVRVGIEREAIRCTKDAR